MDTAKMRACAPLLPAPGDEVIVECLNEIDRLRAENEALRKDAQRWRTLEPLFYRVNLHMDGTAHFLLPGGTIKPRARTAAEAVDAMAPNAVFSGAGADEQDSGAK